ncbi:VOC family protein [Alteromonadaceae bacterium M269]|nr:VOC family protein [Alteromonadaceae bacterium M269]
MPNIAALSLLVSDYDEAIQFFTQALNFELVEDTDLGGGKRWVRVRPNGEQGSDLVLAQASDDEQKQLVGRQMGGRVGFFLHTDDFDRDQQHMLAHGVSFLEEARNEPYGKVAVFEDLYGNTWDLLEPKAN